MMTCQRSRRMIRANLFVGARWLQWKKVNSSVHQTYIIIIFITHIRTCNSFCIHLYPLRLFFVLRIMPLLMLLMQWDASFVCNEEEEKSRLNNLRIQLWLTDLCTYSASLCLAASSSRGNYISIRLCTSLTLEILPCLWKLLERRANEQEKEKRVKPARGTIKTLDHNSLQRINYHKSSFAESFCRICPNYELPEWELNILPSTWWFTSSTPRRQL